MEQKETFWSKTAKDFEEKNNQIIGKRSMQIVFDELAKQTNLGNTLELACGNGTYSKILVKNTGNLTCTDWSAEMVAETRRRLKDFPNIKVEQANCFQLQYANDSFDTVFMANLLHIIPNPKKALTEAKRVLKPNGQIIALDFTTYGMKFWDKIRMLYLFLKFYGKPPKGGQNIDHKKLETMLKSIDFKVEFSKIIGAKSKAVFGKAVKN
ncbi:MAG: hypothetical protein CR986_00015 [Ignavibacteriae bacterium]|nr:MAG: hypothetical protein CR986_00015 [Ignavibacteriota bacterium]